MRYGRTQAGKTGWIVVEIVRLTSDPSRIRESVAEASELTPALWQSALLWDTIVLQTNAKQRFYRQLAAHLVSRRQSHARRRQDFNSCPHFVNKHERVPDVAHLDDAKESGQRAEGTHAELFR